MPPARTAPALPRALPKARPEIPVTAVDERLQLGNNSPALAADPHDSRIVVMANRLDNPDFGCALHVSGDSGRLWVPAVPVTDLPAGADKCYAPEVAFDPQGVLHYLFIALHGEGNEPSGTYLVTSVDEGRSFSPPRQVLGPERYMVRMAIDPTVGRHGRIHLVWLEVTSDSPLGGLPASTNPIVTAYSDDGGKTFSKPVQVSDAGRQRVVAPAVAIGPDHAVHVLYYDLKDDARDYQGLEGPAWEGTWTLVLASSVDGGQTFRSVVVDDAVVPPERVLLIYTMPPPSLAVDPTGRIYAAWHDARNGDWDVFLRRSTDGGATWSSVLRLNDDPRDDGRNQYLPRLGVAPDGRLDAVFYDRRNDPANVRNDVYFTSSSDGGATFAPNLKVTSESSSSRIGVRYPIVSAQGLIEYGSRMALLSRDSGALAAWTDTRNQDIDSFGQDIFATTVDLAEPGGGGRGRWLPLVVVLSAVAAGAGIVARRRLRRRPQPISGPDPEEAVS